MDFRRFDDYASRMQGELDRMWAVDRAAGLTGQLVGRVLAFPSCDGYAYYSVAEVTGQMVKLKHEQVLDAYRDRSIEMMDRTVPMSFVEKALVSTLRLRPR